MRTIAVFFSLLASVSVYAVDADHRVLLANYSHVLNMSEYKGQTYLSFMEKVVKPAIDIVATEGYQIADGDSIAEVYKTVDSKVQRVVGQNGGLQKVRRIADALAGETVTLATLPARIAAVDRSVDRFKLANFLGLASGGGVVIQHYPGNYSYNVHYDTTEQRSGRSYGASPIRGANDASDKAYLNDIEHYSNGEAEENLSEFYEALFRSLLNTDPSEYKDVVPEGQNVLTDFLAVYTAEQARNLMDGKVHVHWDAALLEVTLLAAFHAGQSSFKFYYHNPQTGTVAFTDTVYNQTPCAVPDRQRKAAMRDYWQFSRRIQDPKNCKRSGINITKREFRRLGGDITAFMLEKHPKLAERLVSAMGLEGRRVTNVFYELSKFLINSKTPKSLGAREVSRMVRTWVQYLEAVKASADQITRQLSSDSQSSRRAS